MTKIIRENGVMNGEITASPPTDTDRTETACNAIRNAVAAVSARSVTRIGSGSHRVALMDFGAKGGIAHTLDEITNAVTGTTFAAFEPILDYVAVKLPKWPFDKFVYAQRELGTQMKATGEVMAIADTFEEALLKAVRGAEIGLRAFRCASLRQRSVSGRASRSLAIRPGSQKHLRTQRLRFALSAKNETVSSVKADMGRAELRAEKIPVNLPGESVIAQPVTIDGTEYDITCVSMGNPHAVVFCDDTDDLDLCKIGPLFENDRLFPDRVNSEFVEIVSRNHLKMRVWERGSGETQACGTGACASAVAAVLNGYCDNVCGIAGAHSVEFDGTTPHRVIDLMPGQEGLLAQAAQCVLGRTRAK